MHDVDPRLQLLEEVTWIRRDEAGERQLSGTLTAHTHGSARIQRLTGISEVRGRTPRHDGEEKGGKTMRMERI